MARVPEPAIAHADVETAEQLMRSRFAAYARRDAAYVLETWHPSTKPDSLNLDDDLRWVALQIVEASPDGAPTNRFDAAKAGNDGERARVHFRASWRSSTERGLLEERSTFVRENGLWFYVDGVIS